MAGKVSAPMLPVDVCINIVSILPDIEVHDVLRTILNLMAKDELVTVVNNIINKCIASRGKKILHFVPQDFSENLIGAFENLHDIGADNILYYLALLCKRQPENVEAFQEESMSRLINMAKEVLTKEKEISEGKMEEESVRRSVEKQCYEQESLNDQVESTESEVKLDGGMTDGMEEKDTSEHSLPHKDLNESCEEENANANLKAEECIERPRKKACAEPKKKYKCEHCDRVYNRYTFFSKHQKEHEKIKQAILCDVCGKEFNSKNSLRNHMASHSQHKKKKCPTCGQNFSALYQLKIHMMVKHQGIKPFLCDTCGQGFTSKASHDDHKNCHTGLTPYTCKHCNNAFSRKTTLRMHILNEHNPDSSFVSCPKCKKIYRNIYILNTHMKRKHVDDSNQSVKSNQEQCSKCDRTFKSAFQLRKHVKVVHDNIREFKCTVCSKLFATLTHLQEHFPVHTRQAQFFCHLCGDGFIHRATLKKHLYRHGRHTECQCPLCSQTFDVPWCLKQHMKSKHKNDTVPEMPKFEMPSTSLVNRKVNLVKSTVKAAQRGREKTRPHALKHRDSAVSNDEKNKMDEMPTEQLLEDSELNEVIESLVQTDEPVGELRYLEVEIDGKKETISVPDGAEYLQVGDKIIALSLFS